MSRGRKSHYTSQRRFTPPPNKLWLTIQFVFDITCDQYHLSPLMGFFDPRPAAVAQQRQYGGCVTAVTVLA
jgi:hypothetical protein